MPSVLAIKAACIRIQCPISTTCQLELSLPAYIIEGTFILSALRCFGCSFMVKALTTLVMASTIFSGLNKFFNHLFPSKALFSLAFTVAFSAAWALILCCLFLELWDNWSSVSPLSTAADVTFTTFTHFTLLLNISAN